MTRATVAPAAPMTGSPITDDELIAWSKTKLAAYKYPRRIIWVDAFPLGPSGKVLKRELVAQYKEG